ncbi:YcnI family protein [Streptomyces sp. H10-C2]|uniref:YcnI family copper-binding membrane protein n=1 Tax=unclassified Streptomyces TaxID=2593676 RepID=UPI0024BBC121|nr:MULTISPECIES: YcnI family protein [unclassified Streptomyces]MDJ0342078.1 YcnI family protein [Streptomyces sp. PH10-H1]MDJ0368420.1 YcnI family protein [Streptomyces sp. H10-C2]
MTSSRMRRLTTVGALTGSVLLMAAVPAFAHVTVQPGTAPKGSYSTVSFKVPNEQESASTIKVEVNLPADHPIPSVSTQPVPGWNVEVTKAKLATPLKTDDGMVNEAVTKITWTSAGSKIAPGQFQQFPVSLGPLPADTAKLVFKTLQTYDNNQVARWIEEPKEGAPEPQNPAPSLTLTEASTGQHGAAAPAADAKAKTDTAAASADTHSSDSTARILGIAGIVIGAVGVAFAVLAGRRRAPSA